MGEHKPVNKRLLANQTMSSLSSVSAISKMINFNVTGLVFIKNSTENTSLYTGGSKINTKNIIGEIAHAC